MDEFRGAHEAEAHIVRRASVHVVPDHDTLSQLAARTVLATLSRLCSEHGTRPLRIVLSGGQTPVRTYELLATQHLAQFDWSTVHLYQMDEYVDPGSIDQDYCQFLIRNVVKPFGVLRTFLLDRSTVLTGADGWIDAIKQHERRLIGAGGIDLVLHGIGINGHLGFNEPGSDRLSPGRLVSLSPSTRWSMRSARTPAQGVTLGLRVLLGAQETILLASGPEKASAVANALNGPLSTDCPASWLRTVRRSTIVLDAAAASGLAR